MFLWQLFRCLGPLGTFGKFENSFNIKTSTLVLVFFLFFVSYFTQIIVRKKKGQKYKKSSKKLTLYPS